MISRVLDTCRTSTWNVIGLWYHIYWWLCHAFSTQYISIIPDFSWRNVRLHYPQKGVIDRSTVVTMVQWRKCESVNEAQLVSNNKVMSKHHPTPCRCFYNSVEYHWMTMMYHSSRIFFELRLTLYHHVAFCNITAISIFFELYWKFRLGFSGS